MKVAITGSNGYLGQKISQRLQNVGIDVVGIPRELLYSRSDDLKMLLSTVDAVINLAGAPILQRWTKKNRAIIFDSRVKTTKLLVETINELPEADQPKNFISASAIGIYEDGKDHNESSNRFNYNFVGEVVDCWESASVRLNKDIRRIVFRIGLVIGKDAKTIQTMMIPFKIGLGATIGSGKQPFSFVHIDDVVKAFYFSLINETISGVYNLVAPSKISNKEFTRAFGKALNRPAFLIIPKFVLKILFGKASSLLIDSPAVEPKALLDSGFQFRYPDIRSALNEISNPRNKRDVLS